MPPTVDLLAVQYPGREDRIRDAQLDEMDRLADLIADALGPVLDLPIALFGHSMGATVAYEVARRLEAHPHGSLVRLFVSGRPAPQYQRASMKHLESDDALWEQLRRLGGTSEGVFCHPELRALVLPYLRSDYRLVETYQLRPGPALASPIVACLGDRDPEVSVDEVRGWGELTHGGFDLRIFAGDHFYLIPRQAELINEVLRCMGLGITTPASWPSTP
jgi:pyochelin biosynthetic protein PchC